MWVAEGVAEIRWRVERAPLLPLSPSPMYSVTAQRPALPRPGGTPKALPLYVTGPPRPKKKKKGPNYRTLQSSRKNTTKRGRDSQPISCTIQNTGNKVTELVEFGRKLDEKMKAMLRETKENVQGTNTDAKETGTQINGVDQKEERNIQPEKNEETRIQKNEEKLRNLQDILKCSNIRIIGVPEGEEEE